MKSLPIFGLGLFFALGGVALFAFTLRKGAAVKPAPNVKKSELRALEAQQTETTKLRVASALSVLIGAAMMVFS